MSWGRLDFMPCLECRVEYRHEHGGLCASCSHNRRAIDELHRHAHHLEDHDDQKLRSELACVRDELEVAFAQLARARAISAAFWADPITRRPMTEREPAWAMHVALVQIAKELGDE